MTQWKLVPVTPDQSMCQAGQWKANEWKRFPLRIGDIWQAMLAAAPAPDVQPVAYETENELWWHDAPDINDHIRKTGIPLYRHPPAAAVQDLVAALMIIAGKQRCVDSLMSNVDIALEALKKWEGK